MKSLTNEMLNVVIKHFGAWLSRTAVFKAVLNAHAEHTVQDLTGFNASDWHNRRVYASKSPSYQS